MIEIFVDAPLKICEERDVKGLYAKARQGLIENFTGIDAPYEAPEKADIILKTNQENVAESQTKVIDYLIKLNYIEKSS
jgi:adenylylsulfate kinase-like enzyme